MSLNFTVPAKGRICVLTDIPIYLEQNTKLTDEFLGSLNLFPQLRHWLGENSLILKGIFKILRQDFQHNSFYNSCVEKYTLLRNVWLIIVTSLRMWATMHIDSYNVSISWMVLARIQSRGILLLSHFCVVIPLFCSTVTFR